MKKSKKKSDRDSEIIAIVSDIHFDQVDWPTWNAFRKWHAHVKPDKVVVLGDFVDLGMMSRYLQEAKSPVYAIPQIAVFVDEVNKLVEHSEVIVMEGNHDERWDKLVLGTHGWALKDAKGLTLRDQCLYHGLSEDITWMKEDLINKGVKCGPFILRHGHRQGGRFGGGKHLAANRIMKSLGQSEIFGHHHRSQMFCQTAHGKTAVALANPHMSSEHAYASDPDWQRGFTVLELFGPNNSQATPHPILIDEGRFCWNGKLYDGNKK